MKLTSTAFKHGEAIPKRYTGDGEDVSPALAWSGLPAGTVSLALVCDDPDAPRPEPWVHWVIYAMPASLVGLPEGVPRKAKLEKPIVAVQGVNTWPSDNLGYRGPAPPKGHGTHHYHFKLYALDASPALEPALDAPRLLVAIRKHVIAETQLVGTYER